MGAEFDLVVGRSLAHVLEVLRHRPDAQIVAGATDFIPFVRVGRWRPTLVVDINHLEELRAIDRVEGGLEIGALVTHARLIDSPLVRQHAGVLAEAAGCVAGPQVRARGTLGGNLCTASPAADTVPALLVLDAQVRLVSAEGERRLPLANFFAGPGRTALGPGELLHSVHIPAQPEGAGPALACGERSESKRSEGAAFGKVGKRQALVISVVNGAVLLAAEHGQIVQARIALGAVAPTVLRCPAAECFLAPWERQPPAGNYAALAGAGLPTEPPSHPGSASLRLATPDFAQAADLILHSIRPIDDLRASAAYRRAAAVGLTRRLLAQAWERLTQ